MNLYKHFTSYTQNKKTHAKEAKEIQLCDNFVQTYIKQMKKKNVYLHSCIAKRDIKRFLTQNNNNNNHNNNIEIKPRFSGQKSDYKLCEEKNKLNVKKL